ncbi:heat shock protein 27 [Stomoxys calcitrans]|uniref:SHSP domain-containing protein n=1 Tax=Stomoxys calcitrans TaxID=35570 RepID=A0A1I8P8Y9_STOCA|nr:heat shock protein 27 [Stomoxys calcitrans]
MSLVPTTFHDLARELDRPIRYYPPYDFHLYPYLWDDPRLWWPSNSLLRPMDELVTRRVRNQSIQSHLLDWAYPMRWDNYYNGERVHIDDKGFQVEIDVRNFRPHEIEVKTTDDYVIVQGKHARRNDGNSMVERHFFRKYLLPRGFNANEVISDLSTDGILTIKAPPPPPTKYYKPGERLVRVHETGKLALPWK